VSEVGRPWTQPHIGGGAPANDRSFPVLHSLYRPCANLAGLGPLLVSVGDARWADVPSSRFLAHLSRPFEEQPMLLLVIRPAQIRADTPALSEVLADPLARVLDLVPLSLAAVSVLVRDSLASHADEGSCFCRACQAATAGNPLFLCQLISSLRARGIAPNAAAAECIEELASRALSRAVLPKLVSMPPAATEFVRTRAILGDSAERRHPAALARIDSEAALEAEATLGRAGMFEACGAHRLAHRIPRAAADDNLALAKRLRAPVPGARTPLEDLGLIVFTASTAIHCARIGLLAGDLPTAEEELRYAYDALASIDENYLLPSIAELLAQVVSAQGRSHEAEEISRAAQGLAASDDLELQALWPSVRGAVLAWQERADEAERRAREAVDLTRIRAALSRLTTWYSQSASAYSDRSASDRHAWQAQGPGVTAPGLTRERFLRDILANKNLPDGYAREVALETLDIPEQLFAKMMVRSDGQLAHSAAEGLTTEEAVTPKLAELLERLRRKS
jgi:tetratricopeptide (TPR) repeat protein